MSNALRLTRERDGSKMTETEERWLNYAWSVINCPKSHRERCEALGAAVPGHGRVDGNEVRWPGYLGEAYREGTGILCVGAVHREARPEDEASDSAMRRTNAALVNAHRRWVQRGRSRDEDRDYLAAVRVAYEDALPRWARWRRHFRSLVEDYLGMSRREIVWTNLAKCRVAIHRGSRVRGAEAKLTRLCQREFAPVSKLVDAIRPGLVLCCVLRAPGGGDIVSSWDSPPASPLVYCWQGQSGHDLHNTDPNARRLAEWAPEMARAYRARTQGA